jgi:ABC-2 type transport system ATP-binding protein
MDPAPYAIEVADLQKHYDSNRAVDGLDLSIAAGEVFGLLGPNGAGKTTTVEILEGYREPDSGTVRVLGFDPWSEGAHLRPLMGVMLQEGGLYPGARPLEVLDLFASFFERPDDPERLLELVGLGDSRRTLVRRMSGGQRQRLSLALALIGRPRLVFLDEPTAGMDPHARATTWSMIRKLRDGGVTVVLTTHAMDEAEQLCDRIAIMDRGRIVASGTPSELTTLTGGAETTFSALPGLDVVSLALALSLEPGAVVEHRPGEYLVHAVATPALVAQVACWLRDRDVLLGELRAGRRSLEDLFLRVTGDGHP